MRTTYFVSANCFSMKACKFTSRPVPIRARVRRGSARRQYCVKRPAIWSGDCIFRLKILPGLCETCLWSNVPRGSLYVRGCMYKHTALSVKYSFVITYHLLHSHMKYGTIRMVIP